MIKYKDMLYLWVKMLNIRKAVPIPVGFVTFTYA